MTTGLELARRYYEDCVGPAVLARWPGLPHAGARLGSGSDVLGLDDAMSQDHDWGLRRTLLLDDAFVEPVRDHLEQVLPESFSGLPTRFATSWAPGVQHQIEVTAGAVFHDSHGGITGIRQWLTWYPDDVWRYVVAADWARIGQG